MSAPDIELTPDQLEALHIARALAGAGVPVFVAPPDASAPTGFALPNAWQQTIADPSVVDTWRPGMALAAVMGHALDLVDFDLRNGGHPDQLGEHMPRAYAVATTPSGGFHIFVAPLGTGSRDNVYPGVDVKSGAADGSGRGFAFIAPTVRISKTTGEPAAYAWAKQPDLQKLALTSGNDNSGELLAARIRELKAGVGSVQRSTGPGWWQAFMDSRAPQSEKAAQRAISDKLDAVRAWTNDSGEGFRTVLMRAAMTLGGYVGGGYLDQSLAVDKLREAVCAVWDSPDEDDELWIRQGLIDGARMPFHVYTPADEMAWKLGQTAPAGAMVTDEDDDYEWWDDEGPASADNTPPSAAAKSPADQAKQAWNEYQALGTAPFDPAFASTDQELAEAVAQRMWPGLRYATDSGNWLVRGHDRWREFPDRAAWAVATVARLMPAGATPVPKDPVDRTPEHWQAFRRQRFMTSGGASAIERKLKAVVNSAHLGGVEIADLDSDPEILWAGGLPYDLRESANGPWVANLDPATPHLHTAKCAPADVPTPHWDRFLECVWPDADVRSWALRVLSIALTGYADAALPVLWGDPRNGKALDVDTPVLTTAGWSTMGQLQVGDQVFGMDGKPTPVVFRSTVMYDHPCYRVTTSDGRSITADAEHLWTVGRKIAGKLKWENLTTQELLDRGLTAPSGGFRFRLPRQPVIESQPVDLPIDPYLLGVWLGDESASGATLHLGDEDVDELTEHLIKRWVGVGAVKRKTCWDVPFTTGGHGEFVRTAKQLGLLNNKHIPALYLRAGTQQRLELLRGLLDTDGYISESQGHVEFRSTNRAIANGALYLIRSLGWRATCVEGRATLDGRDIGPKWRVCFTPKHGDLVPFRLSRRAARITTRARSSAVGAVSIAAIEPVESRPVCCIKVANADGLYLAGEALVPTHNTSVVEFLLDVLGTYGVVADPKLLAGVDNAHGSIIYALKGARLAFIDEGPRRGHLATERLKQLTGGGRLTGNAMRSNPVTFKTTHTLVMTSNDEPPVTDPALRARVRAIHCEGDKAIVRAARAAMTPAVWAAEAPGVLAMMIRESALWLADRDSALTENAPHVLREDEAEMAASQDPVREWVEECTVPADPGTPGRVLYRAFVAWWENLPGNRRGNPPTETAFGRTLTEMGYPSTKRGRGNERRLYRPLSVLGGGAGSMGWTPPAAEGKITIYPQGDRGHTSGKNTGGGVWAGSGDAPQPQPSPRGNPRSSLVSPSYRDSGDRTHTNNTYKEETTTTNRGHSNTHTGKYEASPQPNLGVAQEPAPDLQVSGGETGSGAGFPTARPTREASPTRPSAAVDNPDGAQPRLSDQVFRPITDDIWGVDIAADLRKLADLGISLPYDLPEGFNPLGKLTPYRITVWAAARGISKTDARAELKAIRKQITDQEKAAARAEALSQAIAEASGEHIGLPAVADRAGNTLQLTLEQAGMVVRSGLERTGGVLTVDVETSGYPLGHALYALRTIQLGDQTAAVVLDATDPAQRELARTLLGEASWLHAHSAPADLVPLTHAGLLEWERAWDRMLDTVIPAKLGDPASTGSDPGLKRLAPAVLGTRSVVKFADEDRSKLFKAGRWLTDTEEDTPVERSGWAQVDSGCATMVRYGASDVLDTAAIGEHLYQNTPLMTPAVLERERLAQRITARVGLQGVRLDAEQVRAKRDEHTPIRERLAAKVRELGMGQVENPGSAQQIAKAAMALGAELPKTEAGNPSVAEDVLEPLQHAEGQLGEFVRTVLEYRHHNTVLNMFLKPYQLLCEHGDGRARPTVYTMGAKTGRMCLPTSHGLVTDEGFVKPDEIRVGMRTLDSAGCWVSVTAVHRYDDQPVLTLNSKGIELACTPEHRWATTREHEAEYARRTGQPTPPRELRTLGEHRRLRLHLAPEVEPFDFTARAIPAETDGQRFAALIGMLVSDGRCVEGTDGLRAHVYQTERKFLAEFRRVIPDEAVVYDRVTTRDHHELRIKARWLRPRLEAAGLTVGGLLRESVSLHRWVAELPLDELRAFFAACWLSDDSLAHKSLSCGSENLRGVLALAGYRLGVVAYTANTGRGGWATRDRLMLRFREPVISVRKAQRGEDRGDVWCVTTETGTFTAVNPDGMVYLTGNSCVRPNFQQLPRQGGIRACVIADPGEMMIGADFSGVELRVAAALSGDPTLRQILAEGRDIHEEIALQVWGPDEETSAKKGRPAPLKEHRYLAKAMVFGRMYGSGIAGMARNTGQPVHVAEAVIATLDAMTPGLAGWSANLRDAVKRGHTQFPSYSGRIIHLPPDAPHKAVNYAVQGSAREILVDALVNWADTRWGKCVLFPVHDEVDVFVPAEDADAALAELVRCMETGLYGVTIVADPSDPSPYWVDSS